MSELPDLLKRIEEAQGPSRDLDRAISKALLGEPSLTPVTGSIDASLALVERVLPGAEYELSTLYSWARATLPLNNTDQSYEVASRADGNMPLAILAALLRALISKEASNV